MDPITALISGIIGLALGGGGMGRLQQGRIQ